MSDLRSKIYYPVYFLWGEEPYYIDIISDYIAKNILSDAEKGFNQQVFYGKDTEISTIMQTARRFPMMANYQVIIVKEAQALKNSELLFSASKGPKDTQDEKLVEAFLSYIKNPLKSTILVFNYKYKKLDRRTAIAKAMDEKGVCFESPKLYDNKIPGWIEEYLSESDYSITPQASAMLAEYLGADLGKIANELTKLTIALPSKTKITPELIEKNIGISKDYNVFELLNALGEKNVLKANRIISYFSANPNNNPLQKTMVSLYGYFTKLLIYHFAKDKSDNAVAAAMGLHPFIAKGYIAAAKKYSITKIYDIISILREYDTKSKGFGGVSIPSEELQKEMIYKILH